MKRNPTSFPCPNCGAEISVHYLYTGEAAQCKSCQASVVVPEGITPVKPLSATLGEKYGAEERLRHVATITRSADSLAVVIPSKSKVIRTVFVGLWLLLWLVGGGGAIIAIARSLLGYAPALPGANWFTYVFLIVWTIGWTFAVTVASFQLLWYIAGKERLTVTREHVILDRVAYKYRWKYPKTFRHAEVTGLQTCPPLPVFSSAGFVYMLQYARQGDVYSTAEGRLRFEAAGKLYRFAAAVTQEESEEILQALKESGLLSEGRFE